MASSLLFNRVKVSTATIGTGVITLGSALTSYLDFISGGVVSTNQVSYLIEDGSNWEIGTGTYTSPATLTRSVIKSSNSNAAISLSGSAVVSITALSTDIVTPDNAQTLTSKTLTSPTINTPVISGGTVNSASVGATTASTGAFTTLSANSTVSGTGFSTYLASPPAIGGTAAAAITGTTITANTGLVGPHNGTVGAATPSTGAFTTVTASTSVTIAGNTVATLNNIMGRNRIINGNMYTAQRAASATVTAGTTVPTASTGYPCVDRFFVYSTGANVTAAQVAGATNNRNLLQVTGAASVTAVGIGQRIEALNSYDMAGQTCTLSVSIANSLLTTVTWTASYATTTADTFGTIGTPTKTQIATGTFTVTSTLTQYTANISVPAAATKGIEILFTVGAQISGTWQIGNVQFETGSVATDFERLYYNTQLAQCQRYFYDSNPGSTTASLRVYGTAGGAGATTMNSISLMTTMRAAGTLTYRDQAYLNCNTLAGVSFTQSLTTSATAVAAGAITAVFNFTLASEVP